MTSAWVPSSLTMTLRHLGRRQGFGHEVVEVLAEGDDVDLLAAQLVDDHPHPTAAGADARADGIDVVVIGPDGDLRAVPRLASTGLDLHDAVRDLGDLKLEQPLDQPGVGATDNDLRALGGAPDLDDVGLAPVARLGALERDLLGLRQQRLHSPQVEQRVAGIGLLDDAGDDVALAVGVLLELAVALDLADALAHHLAEGLGGDAPELVPLRRVVALVDPVAVLVEVVGSERELHRLRVDLDDDLVGRARTPLVGRRQGVDEHVQQGILRQTLLLSEQADRFAHVEVAHWCVVFSFLRRFGTGLGAGPHSKTVLARSIWS